MQFISIVLSIKCSPPKREQNLVIVFFFSGGLDRGMVYAVVQCRSGITPTCYVYILYLSKKTYPNGPNFLMYHQFLGLDHLDQGCRDQNLRSPMCAMVLLAYHSVITYYLGKYAISVLLPC